MSYIKNFLNVVYIMYLKEHFGNSLYIYFLIYTWFLVLIFLIVNNKMFI